MFTVTVETLIASLESHQGDCVGVFLIIPLQRAKILSHTSHCIFSHRTETASDTSSHCSTDKVVRGEGWSKDRVKKQKGRISLSSSNIVRWNQTAPEAELSQALSCDRGAITTRWINTSVVKVKWCYVVRCYWTWRLTLHDTDTVFFLPFLVPLLQVGLRLRTLQRSQGEGQVMEPLPTQPVNRTSWPQWCSGCSLMVQ